MCRIFDCQRRIVWIFLWCSVEPFQRLRFGFLHLFRAPTRCQSVFGWIQCVFILCRCCCGFVRLLRFFVWMIEVFAWVECAIEKSSICRSVKNRFIRIETAIKSSVLYNPEKSYFISKWLKISNFSWNIFFYFVRVLASHTFVNRLLNCVRFLLNYWLGSSISYWMWFDVVLCVDVQWFDDRKLYVVGDVQFFRDAIQHLLI